MRSPLVFLVMATCLCSGLAIGLSIGNIQISKDKTEINALRADATNSKKDMEFWKQRFFQLDRAFEKCINKDEK